MGRSCQGVRASMAQAGDAGVESSLRRAALAALERVLARGVMRLAGAMRWRATMAAGLAVLAAGCATEPPKLAHTPSFEPVYPIPADPVRHATGAIYNGRQSDNWFGRGRSYQVGDVITVLLNESAQAARQQSRSVSRESSNDVIPSGLSAALGAQSARLAGLNLNGAAISSDGQGTADQRASLTGSVAATVVQVLANGNLVIRGEKQLALSEGTEIIQVSGVIRPEDISANNVVQSRRLANAQFTYRGNGELDEASRAGWGTRWALKFWPF